jgi:hypothetical protein
LNFKQEGEKDVKSSEESFGSSYHFQLGRNSGQGAGSAREIDDGRGVFVLSL